MSERARIPDGYEPLPGGGMRLVDPDTCPAGHPFAFGKRGHRPCAEHRGHPMWTCRCGLDSYRGDGAFVTELRCR